MQDIPGLETRNGNLRLPDPYRLMKDKKYQTLPGFYRVKGNNPDGALTWVSKAKNGDVDAEGFVVALTHIFQKRGYKYDDKDFLDYEDSRLIDFLNSCAMLKEAHEMSKLLEEEIKRREEESGKEKPKLHEAFKNALERKRERKKALPRQVREKDLEEIVKAFGERWSLSPEHIEKWKAELTGLLNKIVRHARFDNRLKSGCSWCGKKTPRLSKPETREEAFKAAVGNLRVIRPDGRRLSLSDEEKAPLFEWYNKRRKNYEFPRGTAKTPVEERAPSEENLRKYLEKIGSPKSWIRSAKGKWKSDFPMLPQLNDLMNRNARRGRARLCVEHMRMQAEGKTMKDAGLEWQTMRRRNAPNPRREQHDARVLKRIERILFHEGRRGADAWRFGPVSFITLEVPVPVDLERVKKKEFSERKPMTFRERLHDETGGICIYCGETVHIGTMHEEHIVPEAKGGPEGQMNRVASCSTCNTDKKKHLPSEWLSGSKWDNFKKTRRDFEFTSV